MRKWFKNTFANFKENFNVKELIIEVVIIAVVIAVCFYEFPYVIYKPGGAIKLDDRIYINDKLKEVGDYNMAYVSVAKANALNILLSKIIKNWDMKPIEDITINNTDYETTFELEKIDLKNSMDIATMMAFDKAGLNYEMKNRRNIIYAIDEKAKTNLEVLDEILEIDGKKFEDVIKVKEYISTLNVGDKVKLKVKDSSNKEKEKYAYIYEMKKTKLIGIVIYSLFDLETDPKIEIKSKASEAGSSGGLMMSLAIYDALTKGDLTHGKKIVGTGTIDLNGTIGEIAGVKYKMIGAEKAGCDIFFISKDNYKEAKKIYKKYHLTFKLVKVDKFDDAIEYLDSLK